MSTNEPNDNTQGPLAGIRVIELGHMIAGPYSGQVMADFGADVIKVEPPEKGDPMRVWGRGKYPLWWTICSRNKRCITVNLRDNEGQDIIKKLVEQADIVVENFRPGTLEKWGLGYDALKAINSKIILVRVSGYGQTGPYAQRAGYAAIGEAMGGMRYLSGFPDRRPSRTGLSLGDTITALYATVGALSALQHRSRTGEGQVVDCALYESVLATMEATIPEYTVSGYIRERSGSILPNVAPSNIYKCKDGDILIAANQDSVFGRLCAAMERPQLAADERFSNHTVRGANQIELDELIDDWASQFSLDEMDALMEKHGVPCGKVYRAPEMLDDPHFKDREAIIDVPHEEWDELKMQNVVPKLSATPGRVKWAGPKLGEHNSEVYGELLDLSSEEIADLKEKKVI